MICPKCGTDSKVSDNPEQAIARESAMVSERTAS